MLYSLVGTDVGVREKAHKELASHGEATQHIYSEQVHVLESLVNASSLFGDKIVVNCLQLGDSSSSKEEMIRLLGSLSESENIFIIDEPFADVHLVNRLTKASKKLFDAREEKIKDFSVFKLCDSFIVKDKKQAWLDFMHVKDKEGGEAIAGALWWKFQTEWLRVKEGKKSVFTEHECERIGKELISSTVLSHRGEKDLLVELERIILSL